MSKDAGFRSQKRISGLSSLFFLSFFLVESSRGLK